MLHPDEFYKLLTGLNIDFFTGVPDSTLKDFCAYLTDTVGSENHVITANEGGAVALAAGHYLATGNVGLVYMQNSGLGNAVNPLVSLADPDVYDIPMLLLVGWRGEPGVKDEPQHKKQGKITLALLDTLGIAFQVLPSSIEEVKISIKKAKKVLHDEARSFAFVVRLGTFAPYSLKQEDPGECEMTREKAIMAIAGRLGDDAMIVSTTGKISRELYEYHTASGSGHERNFLTIGSMGHASHIALALSFAHPARPVYCFDGDGSVIMHMGSLAINGTRGSSNFRHVVFNNAAHDSVGGQPTCGVAIDIPDIARACGYRHVFRAHTIDELAGIVPLFRERPGPSLLEVRVKKGARKDLGRPKQTPQRLKTIFMERIGIRAKKG
jgi:phosphonopyruvate decarboxylase